MNEPAPPRISFAAPLIGPEEVDEVIDTLRSDWITTGPKTERFATDFAARVGAPAALAVNSCTAALHLALLALGVGPGDAVITTTMTFCSTVHVIEHVGATPILCDVEPDTLNLDVAKAADAVTAARARGLRPRVLLPVHFAGHPCDMDPLLALAEREGLAVVEDAAHALPATYRGTTIGDVSGPVPRAVAFSFYATKNLTTGEGGMLTASPDLVEEARVWSLHGMSRDAWKRYDNGASWFYEVTRPGFKYNLTDIAASLGIHQLRKLDDFDRQRRHVATRYSELLADVPGLRLPVERPDVHHSWHLYVLRLTEDAALDRNDVIRSLHERGIATSVHFIPVHLHPYYRERYGFVPEDLPVATTAFESMLSLPLHLRMTDDDIDRVGLAVREIVGA